MVTASRSRRQLEAASAGREGEGHRQAPACAQRIADLNGGTRYTQDARLHRLGRLRAPSACAARASTFEVTQFDMPDWKENAPPVFQQLTPDGEDLHAGHRGRRQQRGGRLHRVRVLADGGGRERARRADERHRDREPGPYTNTSGCEAGGLPRRDERRDLAGPARHLRHRQQARQRRGGGRGRRDHVQRGRSRRAHRTRASAPARRTSRSPPCSRASRSARSSTTPIQAGDEPDRAAGDQRREHRAPLPAGGRRDPQGRPQPRRPRRRAPRLGAGRAGHQRRRLGQRVAARAGRADLQAAREAEAQDPLPVVRR